MTAWLLALALMQVRPAIRTIDRGPLSSIDTPRTVVVRGKEQWDALWNAHAPGRPEPTVDFGSNMVVAVFLGSRPSAGYSVEIVGTRREGDRLVVEYTERRPPAGAITAQVITAPFDIVSIPRFGGDVRFEQK